MATFAPDRFERQAEAFAQARARRAWLHLSGRRPSLELAALYGDDLPAFTSTELYADLRGAQIEDDKQKRSLEALLARAVLEGRTRDLAERVAAFEARAVVRLDERRIPWRAAPAHWAALPETSRRHALQQAWLEELRAGLDPTLLRWQAELLEIAARGLGAGDWVAFWDERRGLDLSEVDRLAEGFLARGAELYGHTLAVYLAQLNLPIDDAWAADLDWAFRAPQFDAWFPARSLMPAVVRTLRGLGIELGEQGAIRLDLEARPAKALGAHWLPASVPDEVHVLWRLVGGYQDYQGVLRGLGAAQHLVHTDRSLPFADRWLGDDAPTLAYGLLLERLTRDRDWLREQLDFAASDDYRVVAHLAWLGRVRKEAATLGHEARLWRGGPEAGGLAVDYAEGLSAALRARHFPEAYRLLIVGAPWSTLRAATWLRAELFAAQLAAYLRREFDDEWQRSPRAARFLVQELWRPGRRHTAAELLGFMGYEGFDAGVLWEEIAELLRVV